MASATVGVCRVVSGSRAGPAIGLGLELAIVALPLLARPAVARALPGEAAEVRRFIVAVGANDGGAGRQPLRYAVTDAERFATVMGRMGGVAEERSQVLREPRLDELRHVLSTLDGRLRRGAAERTELLLFYSGHADEDGLLLGAERLSYRELRRIMDGVGADVRIAILDACASGAITRLKGGQRREAFLVDASSRARGYAFLTSSSENETAQESDRIGASFFTHYLVSGMHGAADVSGDRRVTLTEAYQFAFNETLSRTVETQGGAQHPAYHINLSGTGDVVMTDVRQTSAGLILGEAVGGRFFVRNADEQLVAELFKPAGRTVELGLEPGIYRVHLEVGRELMVARAELAEGQRLLLETAVFAGAPREITSARGGAGLRRAAPYGPLAGRSRLEVRLGRVSPGPRKAVAGSSLVGTEAGSWGMVMGMTYSRWWREDIAVAVTATVLGGEVSTRVGLTGGVATESLGITSLLVGIRRYGNWPASEGHLRPYASAALGTYLGSINTTSTGFGVSTRAGTVASSGGQLGVGIDLPLSDRILFGLAAGYNFMLDFGEALGGRRNYSGLEASLGMSWLFGSPRRKEGS